MDPARKKRYFTITFHFANAHCAQSTELQELCVLLWLCGRHPHVIVETARVMKEEQLVRLLSTSTTFTTECYDKCYLILKNLEFLYESYH